MNRFAKRIGLGAVGLALVLVAGSTVAAADPDGALGGGVEGVTFAQCAGSSCIVRAVGDLDGDGIDDLVLETFSARGLNAMSRSANGLEVALAADRTTTGGRPTTFIPIRGRDDLSRRAVARLGVTIADLNKDGFDDLIWAWASNDLRGETQRITAILGRSTAEWARLSSFEAYEDAIVIERRQSRLSRKTPGNARDLNVQAKDINGDGQFDLVLAADPSTAVNDGHGRMGPDRGPSKSLISAPSEIAVMYGNGHWSSVSRFRDDVRITGVGACHSSFGAIGDLTGDGVNDLVVRRCVGAGMPDTPVVLAGGSLERTINLGVGADRSIPSPGDPARPIPEEPEPPRGYFSGQPIGNHPLRPADAMWIQDVDRDGVGDLLFEFGGKTHLWSGNSNVAERVDAMRTDGVFVDAGFGMTGLSGAWRLADLDRVSGADLVLTHGRTRVVEGSGRGSSGIIEVPPLVVFSGARPGTQVLDLSVESGDLRWHDAANELWAIGDFDGDGDDDLIVGPSLHSAASHGPLRFMVLYGPLTPSGD